jgi:hypothetical protein
MQVEERLFCRRSLEFSWRNQKIAWPPSTDEEDTIMASSQKLVKERVVPEYDGVLGGAFKLKKDNSSCSSAANYLH